MGDVYRATDSVLARTVAVKLLSDRYAQQDDARARFRREALAAARLSNAANVVTVFDVAEHRGRPLIVMEYLEGGTVHDRLRSGAVSRPDAIKWLDQAARALDRAHDDGVVHRDVKPANLLLDRDGNVHVSDFGIASVTGVDALTAPGTVLGTAGYLAPEQARGEPATPASDRYALAVVAFELLTGRRPFAGDTPTAEAFAHLNADVPRATAVDPTLPARVDDVFERALAKDPVSRPPTAHALVSDLRRALDGARSAAVVVPPAGAPGSPARRFHRSRRPRGALAAVIATGVLAAGFVVAVLVAYGDDAGSPAQTRRTAQRAASTSPSTTTQTSEPAVDGAALNDEGFARLRDGDVDGALPLLRGAVIALRGTGLLAEAYASYDLAYARFAQGGCDGVVGLLDRSERIQGQRDEIDELRRRWAARCATGEGDDDESAADNRGHGKRKGKEPKD
jgi:eukaryotic-like serine/threonine-protein kinase